MTLQIYWDLASKDEATRLKACQELIDQVKIKQSDNPDVVYALNRLVKGLSSDRDAAREGFTVALTRLLSEVDISNTEVLDLIMKYTTVDKSMKSFEERGLLYGRIFGIVALIKSSKLKDVDRAVGVLLSIAQSKSYLRELVMQVVLMCGCKVSDELLDQYKLKETCEGVTMLAVSSGKFEVTQEIAKLMQNSHEFCHPRVHSCWTYWMDGVDDLSKFWALFVEEQLLGGSVEKMFLAMKLMNMALDKGRVEVLHPGIIKVFVSSLINVKASLHKVAQVTFQILLKMDSQVVRNILQPYCEKHMSNKQIKKLFQTVQVAADSVMLPDDCLSRVKELIQQFQQSDETKRQLCLTDMSVMLKGSQYQQSSEWYSLLLKFLTLHANFESGNLHEQFPDVIVQDFKPLSSKTRDVMRKTFWTVISGMYLRAQPQGESFDVLKEVIYIIHQVEEQHTEWDDAVEKTVQQVKQTIADFENVGDWKYKMLRTLVIISYVQLHNSRSEAEVSELAGMLDDLMSVIQRLIKKDKSAEGPSPVAVLTDVLLAVLSRSQDTTGTQQATQMSIRLNCHIAEQTFRAFLGMMDDQSIELLLKVVNPADDVVMETQSDASDSASDSDYSDSDIEVDDQLDQETELLKQKIQSAVSDAVQAGSDSEDEDLLDDDQMIAMGFDAKLAEIFKHKSSEKKQKKAVASSLRDFKQRVIGLLDIFVKNIHRVTQVEQFRLLIQVIRGLFDGALAYGNNQLPEEEARVLSIDARVQLTQKIVNVLVKACHQRIPPEILAQLSSELKQLVSYAVSMYTGKSVDDQPTAHLTPKLTAQLSDVLIWSMRNYGKISEDNKSTMEELLRSHVEPLTKTKSKVKHAQTIIKKVTLT